MKCCFIKQPGFLVEQIVSIRDIQQPDVETCGSHHLGLMNSFLFADYPQITFLRPSVTHACVSLSRTTSRITPTYLYDPYVMTIMKINMKTRYLKLRNNTYVPALSQTLVSSGKNSFLCTTRGTKILRCMNTE